MYSYYDYTEEPSVSKDYDLSWLTDLIDETGKATLLQITDVVNSII